MKIVIVGCGQIADSHVAEVRKIEGAKVVGVCDIHEIMASQLAVRFGVEQVYTDYSKLLADCKPDVVHITTPPETHFEMARQALLSGCHVYIEKPFGATHAEAKGIIDIAEGLKQKVTIGYTYYFDPVAIEMRRLVEANVLGDVVHVESHYGYDLSGPFGVVALSNPDHWLHKLPGKLFHNNISHAIHKITEFLHDESPKIVAVSKKLRGGSPAGDIRDDMQDELRVILEGERITGYLVFSCATRPIHHFVRIFGNRGSVTVDYVSRTVVSDSGQMVPTALGRLLPAFAMGSAHFGQGIRNVARFVKADFNYFAGLGTLLRRFYESISRDLPPPIPYRQILQDSYIMEQVFTSLKAQRPVGE